VGIERISEKMSQEARLTHRQRQALQTRRLIVDAATKLFLERGYGVTTMEAIAAEAGVAVSTVYAIFKNKRAFLRELRSGFLDQAHTREIHEEARRQRDPERRLEMIAHQSRLQWEFGGNMITIHEGAAAVDVEAAAELREVLGGRRWIMNRFVGEMKDALRPELDASRAAAILLALAQPEVYRELVEVAGWSPDQYEAWLAETLKEQLLLHR
jgi:AcrR family transcriptional regulator